MTAFGVSAGFACEHQRDRPGDDRRRHARAAQSSDTAGRTSARVPGEQVRRLRVIQRAGRIAERLDADARRDEIRLRRVIDRRRPARAERRHRVVGSLGSCPGDSTRRPSAPTARCPAPSCRRTAVTPVGVAAGVAGGRDDDDAGLDGALAPRRVSGSVSYDSYTPADTDRLTTRMLQRVLVGDDVVERGDDVADVDPRPTRRAPSAPSEIRARARCPLRAPAGVEAVAGDDPGDVRAVTVVVVRRPAAR